MGLDIIHLQSTEVPKQAITIDANAIHVLTKINYCSTLDHGVTLLILLVRISFFITVTDDFHRE